MSNSFRSFLSENTTGIVYENLNDTIKLSDDLEFTKEIQKVIKKELPGFGYNFSRSRVGSESLFVTIYAGADKSEFVNGIPQNDPVSFRVMITGETDNYEVEYANRSITVAATDEYSAYGTKRINLRRFKAKTKAEIVKKLEAGIKRLKETIIDTRNKGEFGETLTIDAVRQKIDKLR